MSEISTVNILPSRTRSGMRCVTPPRERCVKVPQAPKKERTAHVFSVAEEYDRLVANARDLYWRQLAYIKNPNGREEKYKLMSEGVTLTDAITRFLTENTYKSRIIEDVQLWMELSCWNMRLKVFQQTIAVL
jgi:hypothetical protein